MKIEKKYNIGLTALTIILIGIYGYLFFVNNIKLEKINISNEKWLEQPGLIAIQYKENNQPIHSFLRLSDGKEEKLQGNWNYKFFFQDEIAIFGSKPENPNDQMLFILNTKGGTMLNPSILPGPVFSVSQNPKGTYLLLSGVIPATATSTQTYYTCVTERKGHLDSCLEIRKDILKNEKIDSTSSFQSFWDLNDSRRLAIKEIGGKNRLFFYDPWEKSPVLVTDPKLIESTQNITNPKIALKASEDAFERFGNIVIFKNYKNPKHKLYVYIKKTSPLLLVSPRHFIFEKNNTFYILNTERQSLTELGPAPENIEQMSTLFTKWKAE